MALSGPVFQLFTLEQVQPQWHTSISSANSMAVGVSIAAVAFGGGYVIVGYGYPTLFALGGLLALVAAQRFMRICTERSPSATSPGFSP